ncbi:hypothetical protein [Helicobacter pylori]|uniref:hypothetical protein n=1 Tax=Helicobacter pylori TaxID=210 RepID=UPI00040138E5|nr:hypothetical protein [Helicobacter pylori]
MEKLFEKILHEMRSSISVPLAFVVSFIVCIVDPKGIFQSIFEIIFQYIQNKILSFFVIFLFFYIIFLILGKVVLWYRAKKYKQNQIDIKTALKIQKFPNKIKEELYHCYSKKQNKIPRTDDLDRLIGHLSLRDFFEPTESDYIIKPDVLRAIKKYHRIAFKSVYWQQNK